MIVQFEESGSGAANNVFRELVVKLWSNGDVDVLLSGMYAKEKRKNPM